MKIGDFGAYPWLSKNFLGKVKLYLWGKCVFWLIWLAINHLLVVIKLKYLFFIKIIINICRNDDIVFMILQQDNIYWKLFFLSKYSKAGLLICSILLTSKVIGTNDNVLSRGLDLPKLWHNMFWESGNEKLCKKRGLLMLLCEFLLIDTAIEWSLQWSQLCSPRLAAIPSGILQKIINLKSTLTVAYCACWVL